MTSFYSELGGKLAEKWLALLVLPGLLLASTAAVAFALGHSRALDWNELVRRVDEWTGSVGGRPPVAQILLLAVVLLVAAGAGLVIRALSGLTQRLWLVSPNMIKFTHRTRVCAAQEAGRWIFTA